MKEFRKSWGKVEMWGQGLERRESRSVRGRGGNPWIPSKYMYETVTKKPIINTC